MKRDNTIDAFFALIRAGLWEKDVNLSVFREVNYLRLYELAEEQAIIGIVAAGLEHVKDVKVPIDIKLRFVGQALHLEHQNGAMNSFIAFLVEKMRALGINPLLVKGQGVAQCYERPSWRSCGDVDLFLSDEDYEKAKLLLLPLGELTEPEEVEKKHLSLKIREWIVELHGTLRGGLSKRIDKSIDKIMDSAFLGGNNRSWNNEGVHIFIPSADNDIIYVFSHFLQHYFKGGIGVRQICDWCRLLWTYREQIDLSLLEKRLKQMKLVSEWKAFGAFTVEYLGMPNSAVPLYSYKERWKRKALRIRTFIIDVGNLGQNRDSSYIVKKSYWVRKCISAKRRMIDLYSHASIFPFDSIRFMFWILYNGFKSALKGE